MNNKIKNIIFDMNGTMIFDGKYHEIAWKDYAEKLAGRQMSTEEFQHHVLGHTNKDILEYLMGKGTLTEERILELPRRKRLCTERCTWKILQTSSWWTAWWHTLINLRNRG